MFRKSQIQSNSVELDYAVLGNTQPIDLSYRFNKILKQVTQKFNDPPTKA